MEKLIFATNNKHKVTEVKALLNGIYKVISLADAGIDVDIPEPYDTFEENAKTKSDTIYKLTNDNCFGEDTGLEIDALNGEPGVKSARYAGDGRDFEANIDKVLRLLSSKTNRKAQFRTVISLQLGKEHFLFEGICSGTINTDRKETNGFGYDAIFIPEGSKKTFAEMEQVEKNQFSHRGKAIKKLIDFLQSRV